MNHSPQQSGTSPKIQQYNYKVMDFGAAMTAVLNGNKVRSEGWEDENIYLVLQNEKLMIFKTEDKMLHPLIVTSGDMAGQDWVIIEEERRTIN